MPRSHLEVAAGRWAVAVLVVAGLGAGAGVATAQTEEPLVAPPRRAFVTSTFYTGALGGLSGADAICQFHASAAGLTNPTDFVAWLSDATTDAYCHVHGLTGKRADNCGLETLPAAAGPWIRTDGFPFADRIDRALDPTGRVLTPLVLTETGNPTPLYQTVRTGTNWLGELDAVHPTACSNWTVADGGQTVLLGASWSTSQTWTNFGNSNCSSSLPLICLETGAARPWPPYRSGGALAFVTSVDGNGDLGSWPEAGDATGVAAGDAICRALAAAAGLPAPDTFLAWLSTGTVAAKDRFTYGGPWIRIDHVKIADSLADLTDGTLFAPVGQTESGDYASYYGVWTGTALVGEPDPARCGDWVLADSTQGRHGLTNFADGFWTTSGNSTCSWDWLRLYCFSDFPAFIFDDDFESAGVDAWSLSGP